MLYDKEKSKGTRKFISENKNLFAILIIAIAEIVVIPALGSYATGKTAFPQDWIGWVLYITCSVFTALASIFIYLAFHNQGIINVKDEAEYKQAQELHRENYITESKKDIAPISPEEWERKVKRRKVVTQFVMIFVGMLGLGTAVLTYNWTQLLSCIFSMAISVCMGLVHMADVERMWTEGFLEYETYVKQQREKNQEKEEALNGID